MLLFQIATAKIASLNKKLSYSSILVLILGGLFGCQPSLIDIGAVPDKRKGKVVYLTGKVSHLAPFVDNSAYQLQDNTGSVWVVTKNTAPDVGKIISIEGKIQYQSLPLGDRELGDFYVIELERLESAPEK